MFAKDINRPINGVIKVNQEDRDVIRQEVDEYVITDELRKHFRAFLTAYGKAFAQPTADIGVWIAGFFGSGKSHFLKILSYLLDSDLAAAYQVRACFQEKFASSPELQQLLTQATQGETETILFNIDIEGPINKDKTAVLRVFAKMFYNHLGYYGEDLQTARLEQYLAGKGKLDAFRQAFAAAYGDSWEDARDSFAFLEDEVVTAMTQVLGMSEASARDWFNNSSRQELSIAQLVREIKAYVAGKPDNFRLLFMIDEVGQYVGRDTDMLLNLQSLVEDLGAQCGGKVWVMATGQEALDEIIKLRQDEFSRIMARFKTRLSLSSSSVDEVIQRRVLAKTDAAEAVLARVYEEHAASLANLFVFKDTKTDVHTYRDLHEFQVNYPFIPYQFLLLQKVFYQVRKHGQTGKHLSGGERSMLSSFQEAAQKVQHAQETALVPFYRFYDTMNTFLDGSIRRVVDRCEKAAQRGEGLEHFDVTVLKCLYLIRYVEDEMPGNADNVMILLADDINLDKIKARRRVQASLDRLLRQNYVGRTGDVFQFLTDEEQEMQDAIRNEEVDLSQIREHIGKLIFADIYKASKFHYQNSDFAFNKIIDGALMGQSVTDGLKLEFLTNASDVSSMNELSLVGRSAGETLVVLDAESRYYEFVEESLQIRKYLNQHMRERTSKLAGLIGMQEAKATRLEGRALEAIRDAIRQGRFYADGEHLTLKAGEAVTRINQALEYLARHIYSKLAYIDQPVATEDEIRAILTGTQPAADLTGKLPNAQATRDMAEYLQVREAQKRRTTMADVQSRYQAVPYGWREIDVAAVAAMLLAAQQATLKYAGASVRPGDPHVVDLLRKRSEIGRTVIAQRQQLSQARLRAATEFLGEFLNTMSVPRDQNGLVDFIKRELQKKLDTYKAWERDYAHITYPGQLTLRLACKFLQEILAAQQDDFALLEALAAHIDDFERIMDDLEQLESFFDNQRELFDEGFYFFQSIGKDIDYFQDQPEILQQINRIRAILHVPEGQPYDYTRIPELRGLIDAVRAAHNALLAEKRQQQQAIVDQCVYNIKEAAGQTTCVREIVDRYNNYYLGQLQKFELAHSIVELNGMKDMLYEQQERALQSITSTIQHHEEAARQKVEPQGTDAEQKKPATPRPKLPVVHTVDRRGLFTVQTFHSEAEIDAYLRRIGDTLKQQLKGADSVRLS